MGGFDGNGTYVRYYNWTADANNAIPILASRFDTEDNGFAAGLSNCLTRDGQGKPSADISWNNFKLTNLADATGTQDAVNQRYGDSRYVLQSGFTGYAKYADSTANFTGSLQASAVPVKGSYLAYKTSNTTLTSNNTPADDPHLLISGITTGVYIADAFLMISGGAGGIQFALFASSGGSSGKYGVTGVYNNAAGINTVQNVLTGAGFYAGNGASGANDWARITGFIAVSGGNISIRWAQSSSNVSATTLLSGSWLELRRIA